jgi:DnaA family protein
LPQKQILRSAQDDHDMQQLVLELAPPQAPTFASYIPGRNAAAVQALERALAGGERFVYLWGPAGSGKSHLLRSFAGAAYFAAPRTDWTRAAAAQAVAVDDVSRLDPAGQIALFDLYNRLRAAEGSLATSGDAPPDGLVLRPDLRSRLGSGIVLQLHPLTEAEKAAALRERARHRGIALADELIRYLLTHLERDMGTQIAVLDALDRYSLEHKRPITLPLLKEALRSLGNGPAFAR